MKTGNIATLTNKDGSKEKIRIVYFPLNYYTNADYEEQFDKKHLALFYKNSHLGSYLYKRAKFIDNLVNRSLERLKLLEPKADKFALIEPIDKIGEYRVINVKYLKT